MIFNLFGFRENRYANGFFAIPINNIFSVVKCLQILRNCGAQDVDETLCDIMSFVTRQYSKI